MRLLTVLYFLLAGLALFSCTRVIELKLRDTEIRYVVEGVITNEAGRSVVYLSQSKNFNDNNQFPGVSGAIVTIKDIAIEIPLAESQPGVYETKAIKGT